MASHIVIGEEVLMMTTAALPLCFDVEGLGDHDAPEPCNLFEVKGAPNRAGVGERDGSYYLFPRLVATDNYLRSGVARVRVRCARRSCLNAVERLSMALEPAVPHDLAWPGTGGCEDAHVIYLADAGHYVMADTALGTRSPRVALALLA